MPAQITPEKAALHILDIFVHEFEGSPGKIVSFAAFTGMRSKRGLPGNVFRRGMELAAREGWVEHLDARASYRLTPAGYEKSLPAVVKKK